MSNKNEVFEYLIDQLRQQVNKKDVTSFNVSVRISDLDEVKQVIHNLQQHIAGKDDEIRVLKDQLRQQLPVVDVMGEIKRWSIDRSITGRGNYTDEENAIIDAYIGLEHNPYKQQCEDLAHEVLSLKSELARYKKPYIAYVKKTDWMLEDSRFFKKWGKHRADLLRECIQEQDAELQSLKNQLRDASAQIKELHMALVMATGDVEAYKLIRKGGYISEGQSYVVGEHGPEQSGCRKEDAQECGHNRYVFYKGAMYKKCGVAKSDECDHDWYFYDKGASMMCKKCGVRKECAHDWVLDEKGDYFVCAKCGKQEAELNDCQHTNTVGLRKGFAPLSPRAKTQIYKRRGNALYPEIQARRKAVRACGFQNGKAVNLGEFKTQERAAIANRLFNYWKSLGYEDIPTKPQRRQYIWRHK